MASIQPSAGGDAPNTANKATIPAPSVSPTVHEVNTQNGGRVQGHENDQTRILQEEQETLKKELQKQKQRYRDLKQSYREMKKAHDSLKDDHWDLGQEVYELQGDLSELKARFDSVMRS